MEKPTALIDLLDLSNKDTKTTEKPTEPECKDGICSVKY